MPEVQCNDRAESKHDGVVPLFGLKSAIFAESVLEPEAGSRKNEQPSSPFSRPESHLLIRVLIPVFFLLGVVGCAGSGSSRTQISEARVPQTSISSIQGIDAVLPVEGGWRIFQLGQRRSTRVGSTAEAWPSGIPAVTRWTTLAAPTGAFRPVQVLAGQRGYFHIVDAASARLCLYDAEGSLLSTFPLPPEFTPFAAGRAAVFRGADDAYTFIDYGAGEAWQFAERQTLDAGATRWTARGRVKLPGGTRDCVQPPGATDLFCTDASGSPLRFDGALNQVSVRRPGGEERSGLGTNQFADLVRPVWSVADPSGEEIILDSTRSVRPRSAGWSFTAPATRSSTDSVLFMYRPLEKTWSTLPLTPAPNPGP